MRRTVAAGLVLLVPLAAVSAPLAHVHPDDHQSAHHEGGTLHAHFHGHAALPFGSPGRGVDVPGGARLDHETAEETSAAPLFVAVAADPLHTPLTPAAVFTLVVPLERAVRRTPHVAHGHDPPATSTLGPRPPPAFLL